MPLPGNITQITLTGKYLDIFGMPIVGKVSFSITPVLIDVAEKTVIIPRTVTTPLDTSGAFTVQLPATNDADVIPTGFTIQVIEEFEGGGGRKFSIELPVDIPQPVDITNFVVGTPPDSGSITYATQAGLNAEITARTTADSGHVAATDPHGDRAYADSLMSGASGLAWHNVRKAPYNAVGNGIANDTAALQAAIDAANAIGGGVVYLPEGEYALNTALAMKSKVVLIGDGDWATEIIQTSTTANAFEATFPQYIGFKSLRITGPASGSGCAIKFLTETDYLHMEDVTITDFGSHGIDIEQAIVSTFERVVSRDNGGTGFYLHGGAGAGTSLSFQSCWAEANDGHGFWLTNMTYCSFNACASDGHLTPGTAGYNISICLGIALTGCGSENNIIGVRIAASGTHTVNGFFNYASPAGGVGFLVTSSATNVHLTGIVESSANVAASKWVQVDTGCSVTLRGSVSTTANQLAAGTTVQYINSGGVQVVAGSVANGQNTTLGAQASLGDNGVGVTQLANASTVPTTNPTAGVTLYAESGSAVPLKYRDPSGSVRGIGKAYIEAGLDQTSVGTAQTASTHLTVAVEANAVYQVEAWVYWTTASAATVTTSWTGPALATMIWGDTTTGGDIVTTLTGVSPAWSTGTKLVRIFGTLKTGANAGTLTFTFASSVAASVTVKAGSNLVLDRVK